jgi:ankyrin repeat protein
MDPSEPSNSTDTGNNDAVSRLHQAVIDGNEALVRELLRQNDDITDVRGTDGRTALAVAVEHAQLGLMPVLLEHSGDIEAPDASGRTLLHQAVTRNNADLSRLLLEHGADLEAATPDGEKPLWTAASQGYELVAKQLLQCNADVEAFNVKSGTTALFEAVNRGHTGLVKLLLDSGADIDARRTGPQAVRKDGTPLKVQLPPGAPSSMPLVIEHAHHKRHGTSRKAKSEMLGYLTGGRPGSKKKPKAGGSLNLDVDDRLTIGAPPPPQFPIHEHSGSSLVIQPHSKVGKPNAISLHPPPVQHSPPVPVDLVPVPPSRGHPPPRAPGIVGRRIAQQPDKMRPPEADREIPLHRAIMNGDAELVKLLLQHGADVRIPGKDGRSAQQVADEQKEKEFAALLRSGLLLEGPEIKKEGGEGKLPETPRLVIPRALPPPRHNSAKMAACRAFEATVMEFYTDDREQRYQQSAPVYDLLYGKGPQAILDAERPESVAGETPKFTWYHLPANNVRTLYFINLGNGLILTLQMEWVEVRP